MGPGRGQRGIVDGRATSPPGPDVDLQGKAVSLTYSDVEGDRIDMGAFEREP